MEEYLVEKIEKKRIVNGFTQYFLKWKGYPRSENTWEPVEHLYCYELIAEFEESQKRLRRTRHSAITNEENKEETGFDRGLEPEKILGATDTSGKLMFLISWKNSKRSELVPAKVANVKCPQLVIKFYEERLTWIDFRKPKPTKSQHKAQKKIKRENVMSTEDDVI